MLDYTFPFNIHRNIQIVTIVSESDVFPRCFYNSNLENPMIQRTKNVNKRKKVEREIER